MIEAVNSVVSNSPVLRSIAEQTSTTQVLSANPSKVQSAAVVAPYLSPYMDYNSGNGKPIFVVRDTTTGATIRQYPSESQLRAYTKAAQAGDQFAPQSQATDASLEGSEMVKSADFAKSGIEFTVARQAVKQQAEPTAVKSASTTSSSSSTTLSSSTIGSSDSAQYKSVTSVDTQA